MCLKVCVDYENALNINQYANAAAVSDANCLTLSGLLSLEESFFFLSGCLIISEIPQTIPIIIFPELLPCLRAALANPKPSISTAEVSL